MNIVPAEPGKEWPTFKFVIVENTKSNPSRMEMEYTSNPPHLRSIGKINTLYEMHDMMSKSLEILAPCKTICNTTSGTLTYEPSPYISQSISKYGIYFCPDFPDFLLPKDRQTDYVSSAQVVPNVITWGVVRTEPGTVSQDQPFRGTQEVAPRVREFLAYFENEGKKHIVGTDKTLTTFFNDKYAFVKMRAQVFDNLVQYNIWSKSNYEAERLTEWFESEYMDNYIGMFREAGIVNMRFNRRVRDDSLTVIKNGYHVRSVLYYIRTERVKPEFIGPINQINLNISVENLQKLVKEEEGRNIESVSDTIISKWIHRNQLGG
jgi:hypothetical protein